MEKKKKNVHEITLIHLAKCFHKITKKPQEQQQEEEESAHTSMQNLIVPSFLTGN